MRLTQRDSKKSNPNPKGSRKTRPGLLNRHNVLNSGVKGIKGGEKVMSTLIREHFSNPLSS